MLEIAKAKVVYLEAQKQDYTIRALFSGILGIRQVSVGAVVDMVQVNRQLATLPGYRAFSIARRGLGGGTGKPIAFVSTPV